MRHEIEEKWGIDAVDIYGLSEIIGPVLPSNVWKPKTACTYRKITS